MSTNQMPYMDRFQTRGLQSLSEAHVQAFLKQPNIAVVAWTGADGGPRSTPVWYHYEDGAFWLTTEDVSGKARALRRNPRVSLTIDERGEAPRALTIQGQAEVRDVDEGLATRLVERYVGAEAAPGFRQFYGSRMGSVLIRIVPERCVWVDLAPLIQEMFAV